MIRVSLCWVVGRACITHDFFFDVTSLRTLIAKIRPPLFDSMRSWSHSVSITICARRGSVTSTGSFVKRISVMKYFGPNTFANGAQKSSSPLSAVSQAPSVPSGFFPAISASLKRMRDDFGNSNPLASNGSCIYSAIQMLSSVSERSSR